MLCWLCLKFCLWKAGWRSETSLFTASDRYGQETECFPPSVISFVYQKWNIFVLTDPWHLHPRLCVSRVHDWTHTVCRSCHCKLQWEQGLCNAYKYNFLPLTSPLTVLFFCHGNHRTTQANSVLLNWVYIRTCLDLICNRKFRQTDKNRPLQTDDGPVT